MQGPQQHVPRQNRSMRRVVTITMVAAAAAVAVTLSALGASALIPRDEPGRAVDLAPLVVQTPAPGSTPEESAPPTAGPEQPTTVAPNPPDDLDDDDLDPDDTDDPDDDAG